MKLGSESTQDLEGHGVRGKQNLGYVRNGNLPSFIYIRGMSSNEVEIQVAFTMKCNIMR